jgi:curved DNA-binding protein
MAADYKDYYAILGVDRKATEAEIKTAYRKAARKYHPDLHAAGEKAAAEKKFKEINEAYTVLGNKEKKDQYDHLGENWQSGQERQPRQETRESGGYSWSHADTDGFSDFFASIFGQTDFGDTHAGSRHTRSRHGQDLESTLDLTLEEAYRGGQKTLQFSFQRMDGQASQKTLDVKIPAFVREGTIIRLKGQGEEGPADGLAGDLLLTVRFLAHACFTLKGNNLETTVKIYPEQAVLGCQTTVPTLEGDVMITVPPMLHSGQKLRLRSKGWQEKNGTRGDEYITVMIDIPRFIDPAAKEVYQHLADINKKPPKK